ncbi:MAG: hypothetical protein DWQ02_16920 [Bacteroidetes bacterium]|nr:MAG: hypothetical protein DWQ02_16920 [Bacteroidota bacterium]
MPKLALPLLLLVGLCTFFIIGQTQNHYHPGPLSSVGSSDEKEILLSNQSIKLNNNIKVSDPVSTSIDIDSVGPICLSPTTSQIDLTVSILGDPGTGFWDGTGIIDQAAGTFDPHNAGPGIHTIYYHFSNADTTITDSASIEIITQPEAEFLLIDPICQLDNLNILFTGEAGPSATFNWDFDGGNLISENSGLYEIHWDTSGNKLVQLFIQDGACVSDTFSQVVQIDSPLDTPDIQCMETFSSILYEWQTIEDATAYIVTVINGPLGTIVSDTSYLLNGLTPGQSIGIQMVVVSSNSCPGSITLPVCTTLYCPEELDAILPIDPICLSPGQSDTIHLQHNIVDSLSEFSISWQGPGIIDSLQGILVADETMIGQNEVYLILNDELCSVYDTLNYEVITSPTADFQMLDTACLSENIEIIFTGTQTDSNNLSWSLDEGQLIYQSTNNDSLMVSWDSPGSQLVTLILEHPQCPSDSATNIIEILPQLTAPEINCESTLTEVLFTWEEDTLVSEYQVVVQNGPPGDLTSDTSYLVTGMLPGTNATIELTLLDSNNCGDTSVIASCNTLPCPEISIEIEPVTPICFEETDTIQLSLTPASVPDTGTLVWTGVGIIDPGAGLFRTDSSMINMNNEVIVTYNESVCIYSDTINIDIQSAPVGIFSLADSLCLSDSTLVAFSGMVTDSTTFHWDFFDAVVMDSAGPGPFSVQWETPGMHYVSLFVEESGCISDITVDSIFLFEPLDIPIPVCQPGTESLEVSWPEIPEALGYLIDLNPTYNTDWLSDTSILISGILPNTSIDLNLTALSPNICQDIDTSFSCTTLNCPEVTLEWSLESATICLGDSAAINVEISDPSVLYNLEFTIGMDTFFLTEVTDGYSFGFAPNEDLTVSLINVEHPSQELCLPTIPDDLNLQISIPLSSGSPLDTLELCSGLDTTVILEELLINEDAGGSWNEISDIMSMPGTFNGLDGTFSPSGNNPGVYSFVYSISSSFCPIEQDTVHIDIQPTPIADAGEDVTLDCTLNMATLGGDLTTTGQGFELTWSSVNNSPVSNAFAPIIEVTNADTYQLSVVHSASGCSDTDEVTVSSESVLLVPHFSYTSLSCHGVNDGLIQLDSVSGGGTPPYLLSLNGDPFSQQTIFSGLSPGEYSLMVTDLNGCEGSVEITLTEPEIMEVTLTADLDNQPNTITIGEEILLSAYVNRLLSQIDTVIWFPDSISGSGMLERIVSPLVSTTYSVTIEDENGCIGFDQLTIFVDKNTPVFVPNAFSPNGDGINDRLQIYAHESITEVLEFRIFNRWGDMVYTLENFHPLENQNGWDGKFKGQVLNPDVFVYYARLKRMDGTILQISGEINLLK